MKLGPLTKLDERNKITTKKIVHDFISKFCDVTVIFPINDQFGAIRKSDSGRLVCKTFVKSFIKSNIFIFQELKTELKNL